MMKMHRLLAVLGLLISHAELSADLKAVHDDDAGTIKIFREGESEPIVTQNAPPDFRPYIHPIMAPDGKGVLTEVSPNHHKHQTGLYWGFTRVNGRDYFHHPEGDYWKRLSAKVLQPSGHEVKWQVVYAMLDEAGGTVMVETQTWSLHVHAGEYQLDLEWNGKAETDVTIGKYDYGGLFLRMPWRPGMAGEAVNGARQKGPRAEGQRAPWVDVGLQVPGRDDLAHIAIFDHGDNAAYPQPWRVDGQLGVGPVRARLGDWHIAKGESETIRHGVHVYTGALNDRALTQKWMAYSGKGGTWDLWRIAQQEGRNAKFLTPQAAVEQMTLQDGFAANVYASEPMITQPMAFCWDDRGRMWIAENRDYETRGTGFSNSGDSRILILEDTDRDGVADTRKVFSEGIPFPSAIAVGFGGLWLGAPPNLLFLPDRDGDDKADDDIEVRLTGWGIRDRHETLNSFHWGPDGWLYGCQGFATPSRIGKPAGEGKIYRHQDPFPDNIQFADDPVYLDGGIFRYHPTKDRFEVVAHGFSNPWGIDYDAKGQLFISACVIPHLWHVIPGGIYHRQGGRHINPYFYSDIRTIADHRHRSAHGGARVYLSDAFPEKYHGRIFMANIHEHAVLTDILEPRGSGFVGRHGDDFMLANNAQWIGFSMEIGPEGAVYVLDWHDADICGKDVLNKDTGRVFRIAPSNSKARAWPGRYDDLAEMSDLQLANLQTSASAWHARRARLLLQQRSTGRVIAPAAIDHLKQLLSDGKDADHRLRALWSLHVVKQLPFESATSASLQAALRDADEHIRAWAIQLACEDGLEPSLNERSRWISAQLVNMARRDESPVVRLYLASALQRINEPTTVWAIAGNLTQHVEDGDDHNIPKMIWFGIEPHVMESARGGVGCSALEVARASKLPMITQYIARRLADGDQSEVLVAALAEETETSVVEQLLHGLRDGLQGRADAKAPAHWKAFYSKLDTTTALGQVATSIAQLYGDTEAAARMMETMSDSSLALDTRVRALRGLAERQHPPLKPLLLEFLTNDELRKEAIRAMAAYEESAFADGLLKAYQSFDAEDRLEAIQTMASRRSYGRVLTEAIKRSQVDRADVPAYVARQLRRVVGNSFVDVWGPIDALSADKQAALEKYQQLLTPDALKAANPKRGRLVFKRTCYACHKLYGDGGIVGPDITGANRGNLTYILGNVITPSAEIQDAYKMTMILTDEGRIYSGIVAGEDNRQVQLRVASQAEPVSIPKSTIESREIAAVSMMPEGILATLKDAEVLDLVAYLQTKEQVPEATE